MLSIGLMAQLRRVETLRSKYSIILMLRVKKGIGVRKGEIAGKLADQVTHLTTSSPPVLTVPSRHRFEMESFDRTMRLAVCISRQVPRTFQLFLA